MFLEKRDKDNLRKAAHRMEEVFKSVRAGKRRPADPTTPEEFRGKTYQIWLRIVEINKLLGEIAWLIGSAEAEEAAAAREKK